MKLTADTLRKEGACANQVARFVEITGGEVEITETLCLKYASEFDWDWVARRLLTGTAWKVYDEARAPARKTLNKAVAPAWKAYTEARATTRKALDEARATAGEAFDEAIAPAQRVYHESRATAFARAFNMKDG